MKNYKIKFDSFLLIVIGILLVLLIGFRPLEYFADTANYIKMIHDDGNILQREPTFWLINEFNKLILGGNNQIFFLIYAVLGITLKLIAIKRYSLSPIFSLYIYICLYLILHEAVQIRVGVASGFFLLSLKDLRDKNTKNYLIKTILAILFHYSAIIMLLIYFINPKKINFKLYFMLPIIGLILYVFKDQLIPLIIFLSTYTPSIIANKINIYLALLEKGIYSKINLFNVYYLSIIIIYYISLYNINKFKSNYDILLIKILCYSIITFSILSIIPVFAFRVSEFLGIVIIILLADFISIFKNKSLITLVFIIWGGIYFYSIIKKITFFII